MSPDSVLIADTLVARMGVRQHDRWRRTRLLAFQHEALDRLLRHARTNSPYYREALRGAPDLPLAELPVLTKATLMEQWDRICTSDALRLAAVEGRLAETERAVTDPGRAWRGRWWLPATGGTTGRRGVFVWNRKEWTQVLTSYARVNDWAGGVGRSAPPFTYRLRELAESHPPVRCGRSESSLAACAGASPGRPAPLSRPGRGTRSFQPRLLVIYASMVGPLAPAQLTGHLHIRPDKVVAASEVLTPDARAAARAASTESAVVDSYAATETANVASTCSQGGWPVRRLRDRRARG